jgi:flagellin
MSRINTNVASLTAQNSLNNSQNQLQTALTRLSTGLQINSGADDPAGLIEAQALGSEITADNSAISNSKQAEDLISTADSALSQVSTLLQTIRGLVSDAANTGALSASQISADQLQVDSSLQAINQISGTTEFQGTRLLDGSLDFQTSSAGNFTAKASGTFGTNGVDAEATGTIGSGTNGTITISASTKGSAYNGANVVLATGAASAGGVSATYVTSTNTLTVTITSGSTASDVATAINASGAFSASASGDGSTAITITPATEATGTIGSGASGFKISASNAGTAYNGVDVVVASGSGATSATYTTSSNTLSINLASASSSTGITASDVVTAIGAITGTPFSASVTGAGTGAVTVGTTTAATSGGAAATGPTYSAVTSGGSTSNEYTLSASTGGSQYNGATVTVNATAASAGAATATYSTSSNAITVTVASGATAANVVSTINGASIGFSATAVGSGLGAADTGTLSATTSGGVTVANVSGLQVNSADFGTNSSVGVNVDITKQATQASLVYSGGALTSALTLQIGGSSGYQTFNFDSGATETQIATAINADSDSTGVSASISGGKLTLTSANYGSSNFVSVNALAGSFTTYDTAGVAATRTTGTDVQASINGIQATGSGLQVSLDTSQLNLQFNVASNLASNSTLSFNITGGGATFQLGPNVTSSEQSRLGIASVSTATLGGVDGALYELQSGGDASLATDPSKAASIVDEVITEVTSLQGRLGAFQSTTLETNVSSLTNTVSNLTSAQSSIQDTDYAAESAALTRAQILVQAGTSVLSIANSNPQNVLTVLKAAANV